LTRAAAPFYNQPFFRLFSCLKAVVMGRRAIKQLTDGDQVDDIYLVGDKQLRANRQGNLYLQLDLQDRTGTMNARLWNATEGLFRLLDSGDFVRAKGKVQLFQGALQMILSQVTPVEAAKVDLGEFLPHTEQDVGKMLDRCRGLLLRLANPYLRALAECFFMDDALVRDFCRAPAGIRNHHAFVGGLLEHVTTLLDAADRLLPLYPDLDRDLLLMGVFLHDIGKVRELAFDKAFAYTDEGQLIGHLIIGVELLNEKVRQVSQLLGEEFPKELLLRLKHMILSHHGSYEFGSPKLPMTPEAIALTHLDNLDAKVHAFAREIKDDKNPTSAWTPFNQALQRKLYKGPVEDPELPAVNEEM
jgi:3'-5' exoribonuclease